MSRFIARKPNLPPAVVRSVVAEKPQALDGTPLRPATLGHPGQHRPEGGRPSVFGGSPDRGKPDAQGVPGAVVGERNPAAGKPQARPGRPAPQADGGAPNPRNGGGGERTDRTDRTDRNGRPTVGQPSVGGAQPADRERPGRRPAFTP